MRGLLSTDVKEEIRRRVDLVEVVGSHVTLKKAGRYYKGLCPFHQEKTPSFYADRDKGLWHCFGCFPPGQLVKTPFGYHPIETVTEEHPVVSGRALTQRGVGGYERREHGGSNRVGNREVSR